MLLSRFFPLNIFFFIMFNSCCCWFCCCCCCCCWCCSCSCFLLLNFSFLVLLVIFNYHLFTIVRLGLILLFFRMRKFWFDNKFRQKKIRHALSNSVKTKLGFFFLCDVNIRHKKLSFLSDILSPL